MQFDPFLFSDLKFLSGLQPPDWGDLIPRFKYFIDSPYCHPIKLSHLGKVIAVGTSMMHRDTAWLACIIVHPEHRNRGLGNAITQQLINNIDGNTFPTIYLDATDYGYPVYLKLGFDLECEYIHLKNEQSVNYHPVSEQIVPFKTDFQDQIFQLDQRVSGEDRRGILAENFRSAQVYVEGGKVEGYYVPDWGDRPVVALNNVAGVELMKNRIQHTRIAVLPAGNAASLEFLDENHFKIYKTSRRMRLGPKREWMAEGMFNRISGQLG